MAPAGKYGPQLHEEVRKELYVPYALPKKKTYKLSRKNINQREQRSDNNTKSNFRETKATQRLVSNQSLPSCSSCSKQFARNNSNRKHTNNEKMTLVNILESIKRIQTFQVTGKVVLPTAKSTEARSKLAKRTLSEIYEDFVSLENIISSKNGMGAPDTAQFGNSSEIKIECGEF